MKEAHLRDFIAVIESGSVRAAARRLGLTQAAVSKNLTALERSLGLPLLLRSTHGVEPTEAGQIVLRRARVVDAELRKLQEEIDAHSGERRGVVSIGISSTVEALLLARSLGQFRRHLPEVLVSVVGGRVRTTLAALREGRIDFAIGPAPPELIGSDLHVERLLSMDLVVVARKGHPAAQSRSLADLGACEWIVGTRRSEIEPAIAKAFAEGGLAVPAFAAQCDSFGALLHLLLQTDMVTCISRPAIETFCRAGLLELIPLGMSFPPVVQYLISSSSRPLTDSASVLAGEFRRASRKFRR